MLPLSKILSSCRSDELYINSFVIVTIYFMEQTDTIHSVDTGFVYAVVKLSFSKQYKIQCFNPLDQGLQTYLFEGHIRNYTAICGPDFSSNFIVSAMFHSPKSISFSYIYYFLLLTKRLRRPDLACGP